MANPTSLPGDLIVAGSLRVAGSITPAMDRDEILSLAELQPFTVPWTLWRVHDAVNTNLPGTAADDDLGLVGGTFGTDSPSIQSVDFGGTTTTAYARAQIPIPWEYEDGQTLTLRLHAGMLTVADDACTLDVECHKSDEEAGAGSDLCTTDAKDINSAVMSDQDFTITPSGLSAGDMLDVRIKVTGTDAGNASDDIIAVIGAIQRLCDVR